MKELFVAIECEIIEFEEDDVIATSDGTMQRGMYGLGESYDCDIQAPEMSL